MASASHCLTTVVAETSQPNTRSLSVRQNSPAVDWIIVYLLSPLPSHGLTCTTVVMDSRSDTLRKRKKPSYLGSTSVSHYLAFVLMLLGNSQRAG